VDGIPRLDGVRAVLPRLSPAEQRAASERKQSYFQELLKTELVPIYPSTIALVAELRANGARTAVVSSSRNVTDILVSVGVSDLFDVIVDGNAITRGKPDPEVFLLALARLRLPREACVVFEDAALGVAGARNAGIFCVGIDRYGKPERLGGADLVVSDLAELDYARLAAAFNGAAARAG